MFFDPILVAASLQKLTFALVALFVVWMFLRLLDTLAGVRFRSHVWEGDCGIAGNPMAKALYYGLRFAGGCYLVGTILAGLALVVVIIAPAGAATFPTSYDKSIRQSAERWMPGVPWRLFKAQLYQESRLDPAARSAAGAEGVAQFMPATWAEIAPRLGYGGLPRSAAAPSIESAAYYMGTLKRRWEAASEYDRHKLAAASYNAGGGNVSRAVRGCGGTLAWDAVAPCLPAVTGEHSAETIGYVRAIWRWWAMMEAGR